MQTKVHLRYLRIAPRKVRLVADLIRGKQVEKAQTILNFTVKRATNPLLKLLNSGLANAKNNLKIEPGNLYISKITVDEGPKLKRWMPRARGQAYEIQKKTSHVTIILDEIKEKKAPVYNKATAGKAKKEAKKEVKTAVEPKKDIITEIKEKEDVAKEFKKQKQVWQLDKPKPKTAKIFKRIFSRKAI